jgi:glycogen debranching enzyme
VKDLYEAALATLLGNVKRGKAHNANGLEEYCYLCPSRSIYHNQWLWDSCFHAIVMAHFRPDLAKAELRTLVSKVQDDGFLPHLITWQAPRAVPGIDGLAAWLCDRGHLAHATQPPVLSVAVEQVYRLSGDSEFLAELLPRVKRHYRYFAEQRDPDGDGLVSIIFPIESGMDHLPAYDEVLAFAQPSAVSYHLASLKLAVKYLSLGWSLPRIFAADEFSVEDVGFNAIYAYGLRAVARLAAAAGDPDEAEFIGMAQRVERALVERCYDAERGTFHSLYSRADRPSRSMTVASLLPLLIDDLPRQIADRLVNETLLNEASFWTPYPVPSVSIAEPTFRAGSSPIPTGADWRGFVKRQLDRHHLIWRGPTWINTNWLLARGLRQHGYEAVADELTRRTARMVEKAGFWEYYNPLNGEGLGAGDFGWSTLVVDMLADAADGTLAREFGETVVGARSPGIRAGAYRGPALPAS